jgi:hypothetical protein
MRIRPFLFSVLVGTAGFAQSADFGIQVGGAIPTGDIAKPVDHAWGLTGGLQARMGFSGGHAIVPRADYAQFSGTVDGIKCKESVFTLGVDYNYYFSRRIGDGLYVGGGLGYLQKKETYTAPAAIVLDPSADRTKDRAFMSLDFGAGLNKHMNLYSRIIFFADERNGERWDYYNHEYEDTYSTSTMITLGVEFHF